jgi:hypothetical protein
MKHGTTVLSILLSAFFLGCASGFINRGKFVLPQSADVDFSTSFRALEIELKEAWRFEEETPFGWRSVSPAGNFTYLRKELSSDDGIGYFLYVHIPRGETKASELKVIMHGSFDEFPEASKIMDWIQDRLEAIMGAQVGIDYGHTFSPAMTASQIRDIENKGANK